MKAWADLHLHTLFSDGTYSPQELINKAKEYGLKAIAVVDHDTTDGIAPAIEAAAPAAIEVLAGIELTCEYEGAEVHVLGYLIDCSCIELKNELAVLRKNRIERVYKITDKLKKLGIDLEPQAVFDLAKGGCPGRLHIARAMVETGVVSSTYEAFKKYIGDKCPGYVSGFRLSPCDGIKLIKDACGIPVLAHPYIIGNRQLIVGLVDCGLMGLEVYYPEHTETMVAAYLDLAKSYNLLVTGGSDCHGAAKPEAKIGSVKIPYELVEALKKAKNNL